MVDSRPQTRKPAVDLSEHHSLNEPLSMRTAIRPIATTLLTLFLAALSDRVCKLSLSPIYGSIPSEVDIIWVLLPLVALLSTAQAGFRTKLSVPISVLGCLQPVATPILTRYSGKFGPYWGPRITYAITSCPIIFVVFHNNVDLMQNFIFRRAKGSAKPGDRLLRYGIRGALAMVLSYVFLQVMRAFEGVASFALSQMMSATNETLSSRYGMQAFIAGLWIILSQSGWTAFIAILPLLHLLFFSPHLPLAHNTGIANVTLQSSGWSLIARQESVTGYISVLDNVKEGFRVMRCDHSLLGGEWINKPEGHPAIFNEPIYSIFVMLEAVRLVEPRAKGVSIPEEENTLVVGLGVGTAPSALIAHGVHTTTIEIDPVVHDFASYYFNLPHNHTSIIGDAVEVVKDMQNNQTTVRYDYIVHDVFTGGAEPVDLFTLEFLTGLRNLLKSDGVIAINYAGDLLLPSAISFIRTILSVFGKCRLFREVPQPIPLVKEDYTNVVFFCRKSRKDFSFRSPIEADFLGSPARRQHLLPKNEILDVDQLIGGKGQVLNRGQTEWLQESQMRSAVGHWHLMRKVLPDTVWNNW